MKPLKIRDKEFTSRLFTGTGKFSSNEVMYRALEASGSQLITVALKRVDINDHSDDMLKHILQTGASLLPNTSGVRTAKEAVFAAQLAREALETNWLKLEIHPDPHYLMPDPVETLKACEELAKDGFNVMPYIHADPVLCKRLEEAGAACVMPLGAPIGSNKGLLTEEFLRIIIEQSNVPVVVEAIADAQDPVEMARAFRMAVEAGRMAYEAKLAPKSNHATATSPMQSFLNDIKSL